MNEAHFVKFVTEFYGYGSWTTKDWFLGIEEGGGGNFAHMNQKLEQFYNWGNIEDGLVDNYDFQSTLHECIEGQFLRTTHPGPKKQSTWYPPLKALLCNKTGAWTNTTVKRAQIDSLGRQTPAEINSTWIELFPLPNPGIGEYARWNEWTSTFSEDWNMPVRRADYESRFISERITFIKEKMTLNKPRNIVAYIGTNSSYLNYLEQLLPASFTWIIDNPLTTAQNILYCDIDWADGNVTRIFRCYHPSRTNNNAYWERLGALML